MRPKYNTAAVINKEFNLKAYAILDNKETLINKLCDKIYSIILDIKVFNEIGNLCKYYAMNASELSKAIDNLPVFALSDTMEMIKFLCLPSTFGKNKKQLQFNIPLRSVMLY